MVLTSVSNSTLAHDQVVADEVPLSFAKALLVQARAFGRDVDAVIQAAGFPINPLASDSVNDAVISVEQYSRLCLELFDVLQDESGGIIQGVPRLLARPEC
ncbi:hypothetical protein [Oceanicoccus sp. KOV_DT_Chl]|uniref:hypothetical protein n=1 Tax=Oceanicoccus sp. KOV_DT_Chl TaxID=1904639 RepID=UPI000C7B30BC|nr:hypothetical protein [Oceanicoccus sp. KOV_DT_Chl]